MITTPKTNPDLKSKRGRCANGAPNPIDKHVGYRIFLRRRVLNMSQKDMSALLGLTFQQIQKYENGTNRISASRLWDFSQILGVDINFFYEDMPKEVMQQSPMQLSHQNKLDSKQLLPLTTPENTNEAQELLKAYFSVSHRPTAKLILGLLQSLK